MKIGKEGFFDLTYSSNIHAGESWPQVFDNLKEYLPRLKTALAPEKAFAIGLRLSNQAVTELLQNTALFHFKEWLEEHHFYVMTVNGFPYGDFHTNSIKDKVYIPDWTTEERRNYSLKIVDVLAALTPAGGEAGFSTSPLSYKPWLNAETTALTFNKSALYLSEVVAVMAELYEKTGQLLHIDIEPEPDCLIETSQEFINFFEQWLIPVGASFLAKEQKISLRDAEEKLRRHVQFCYDICHASVEFEKPADIFKALNKAGIKIGKIQVSAAISCKVNLHLNRKDELEKNLSEFIDPVYLHQVIKHHANGELTHEPDLTSLTLKPNSNPVDELRSHYHVPIFLDHYELLHSTQSDIIEVLKLLRQNRLTPHLEIETYTWEVLPPSLKLDLESSIKREYEWVIGQFNTMQ